MKERNHAVERIPLLIDETVEMLIADDDKMLCEVLEEMLSKEVVHLKASSAYNGYEAIEKIKDKMYDLILTDIMMPGANGIEVLKTAKEVNDNVLVIMVTGFASLETAMEAIKKGAYDYITKPFKLDEIKLVVQNACEKIKLTRENQTLLENLKRTYQELHDLKNSGQISNASVVATNKRMGENQEKIPENLLNLYNLSTPPPASHYLWRRRTDKGYILVALEKLGKLRNEGVLTEEEFQLCKNRFLSEL